MRFSRRVATLIVGGVAVLVVSVSACQQKRVDEPASARTYQLAVSRSSDRSSWTPLTGRVLRGRFYVFASPDAGVERVRFILDAASLSLAPFELALWAPGGSARPLDTTLLDNGLHTLTAVLDLSDGGAVLGLQSRQARANHHQGDRDHHGPDHHQAGAGATEAAVRHGAGGRRRPQEPARPAGPGPHAHQLVQRAR
jgi:hypothetical protein